MCFEIGGHGNGNREPHIGHLVRSKEGEIGNYFELRTDSGDDAFGFQTFKGAGADFARHSILGLNGERLAHVADDAVAFGGADRDDRLATDNILAGAGMNAHDDPVDGRGENDRNRGSTFQFLAAILEIRKEGSQLGGVICLDSMFTNGADAFEILLQFDHAFGEMFDIGFEQGEAAEVRLIIELRNKATAEEIAGKIDVILCLGQLGLSFLEEAHFGLVIIAHAVVIESEPIAIDQGAQLELNERKLAAKHLKIRVEPAAIGNDHFSDRIALSHWLVDFDQEVGQHTIFTEANESLYRLNMSDEIRRGDMFAPDVEDGADGACENNDGKKADAKLTPFLAWRCWNDCQLIHLDFRFLFGFQAGDTRDALHPAKFHK